MPIARTRPNSERLLSEKPSAAIAANVPIKETGTATSGMIEARQVCRKTRMTNTTSAIAWLKVSITARIESRVKPVVSNTIR